MRKLLLLLLLPLLLAGCVTKSTTTERPSLTIYTYDSLAAEWGLLPQIKNDFENKNNVTLNIKTFPDTGTMINQSLMEKNNPQADIVLGFDDIDISKNEVADLFQPYKPQGTEKIPADLILDTNYTATPFDYGFVGFVYNSEKIQFTNPISLMDLTSEQYKNKIIIEQPGLSSPGTQLLLWTKSALHQEDYPVFWKKMAQNILTVAPDWSTAYYSQFLNGEAPIVLSYLTSPAYHIDQEQVTKYKAIPIKEGYYRQIEGAGIIKNTQQLILAQKFIDYLITPSTQEKISQTQWMFPIIPETKLPDAYQQIIIPQDKEINKLNPGIVNDNLQQWLVDWNKLFLIE